MEVPIQELIEQGRRHFISKNYPRAQQEFQKAIRSGAARYADIFNMLGVIYHSEGRFNDAIESFREALEINPNYMEANLNLAILYNDLGEYKASRSLYKRVQDGHRPKNVAINPVMRGKIANLHAELAGTYQGIGLLPEAIEEYKKALRLCPTYKDIRTHLATCYRENHQKDLALKELTEVIKTNPNYLPARIQLGLTHYALGAIPKAIKEWQEVLKKDKHNPAAKMYLRICEGTK